ncbi:RNA polymerase sigma factor, sigma-70 family [Segniliparus rotundus DSM 44985]|uniref:RNA polymerase sigma factor, sigma-70 family n=2 Tax=Segniliparus rotundus TaxID=286802 RepID=D6ZBL0_SEGRD|nr:RNA polymerase sigma factor, sigma-70 family [Segniliparus rotundus DSM 44985]
MENVRMLWPLLAATTTLTMFGACPTAAAESCFHGIYLDAVDGKAYACPWGGGMVHTTHGDVYVDVGGIVLPDSAYAFGLPDDGADDPDGADDGAKDGDHGADDGDSGE